MLRRKVEAPMEAVGAQSAEAEKEKEDDSEPSQIFL